MLQPWLIPVYPPAVAPCENVADLTMTQLVFTPRKWLDAQGVKRCLFTRWMCECGHVIGKQIYSERHREPAAYTLQIMQAHASGHAIAREMLCLR